MSSRWLWTMALSLTLLSSLIPVAAAQSTYGSITGLAQDTSVAAITDAQVTLTNTGTSEKRTQATGPDGLYSFVNLIPGEYRIDAEKQEFKHFTRANVEV